MADYRETHVWFDGRGWSLYTERPADARKAERLFGPPEDRAPTAKGARQVWNWRNIPPRAFRWGRRRGMTLEPSGAIQSSGPRQQRNPRSGIGKPGVAS